MSNFLFWEVKGCALICHVYYYWNAENALLFIAITPCTQWEQQIESFAHFPCMYVWKVAYTQSRGQIFLQKPLLIPSFCLYTILLIPRFSSVQKCMAVKFSAKICCLYSGFAYTQSSYRQVRPVFLIYTASYSRFI